MIDFSKDYCDLNDWCCDKYLEGMSIKAVSVDDDSEITSFIHERNLRGYFLLHQKYFSQHIEMVHEDWSIVEPTFKTLIKKYFDYDFTFSVKVYFSLFSLYPRDIKNRQFMIPHGEDWIIKKSIIIHEMIHFMFYDVCEQNGLEDNQTLWVTSELLIPLWFNYLNERDDCLGQLTCSCYCLTNELIERSKPIFEAAVSNGKSLLSIIKDLKTVVERFT